MDISELIVGDSIRFTVQGGNYPASAGWSMSLLLKPRAGGDDILIEATPDGDDFVVAVSATETTAWSPGAYTWWQRVEKDGERYTVATGQLTVKALTGDGRSVAAKALEDAKAAFATFTATKGTTRRYRIGEREMEFNNATEIIKIIGWWEQQVAAEESATRLAQGLRPRNRILTRFVRPR
ncbi:MAG: hypothetical protein KF788_08840 [Piscinibacter sp.]|nr:hypothetical protein [Piscinibacter sp.]